MKFNITSYTLFLFMMVVFFPSLIFAPWKKDDPPKQCTDGIERTCPGWIEFNGFTLNDPEENFRRAVGRNYKIDKKATAWAAVYAFMITGRVPVRDLSPQDFCDNYGDEGRQPKPFLALKDERKTCEKWIKLYRFSEDHWKNHSIAFILSLERMPFISIWAYIYYLYAYEFGQKKPLTPLELCTTIGKSVEDVEENRMSFMSEKVTRLTCRQWIHLYEYTDEPQANYNKAIQMRSNVQNGYFLYINYFPFIYANKLRRETVTDENVGVMTPEVFCREYNGEGDTPKKYPLSYTGPDNNYKIFVRFFN